MTSTTLVAAPATVTSADRLAARTRTAVLAAAERCGYRVSESRWAGGDHSTIVTLRAVDEQIPERSVAAHEMGRSVPFEGYHYYVPSETCSGPVQRRIADDGKLVVINRPEAPAYYHQPAVTRYAADCEGSTSRAWSKNGKWTGTNSTHSFVVRPDWLKRIERTGLAVVDGMLTLDAQPVRAKELPAGVASAWRAVWAQQGRGVALVRVEGFLVRDAEGRTCHAPSLKAGVATLRRRAVAEAAAVVGFSDADLAAVVTVADSLAAGNCETGTDDWRNRHLNGRRSATVREVMVAAHTSGDRVELAARACRAALRRLAA